MSVFIIEGWSDDANLRTVFPHIKTIVTNGTRVNNRVKSQIQECFDNGENIFILSDPDEAGDHLCGMIQKEFTGLKRLLVDPEKASFFTGKRIKTGIEYMSKSYIRELLVPILLQEELFQGVRHFTGIKNSPENLLILEEATNDIVRTFVEKNDIPLNPDLYKAKAKHGIHDEVSVYMPLAEILEDLEAVSKIKVTEMSNVEIIENKEQFEALTKEGVVLVDFFAQWCGPCKMIAPSLENLASEGFKVVKVDIDVQEALKEEYDIMSVPTMVFLKDGKEVQREVGFRPEDSLREILKSI